MRNKAPNIRILTVRDQKVVLDSDLAVRFTGCPRGASMNSFGAIGSVFPKTSRFNSLPKNLQL
jgi:hypothetical protein